MEEVLVEGTFKGLSAIQELSSRLRATTQAQQLVADKVGPGLRPLAFLLCSTIVC